MEKSYILSILIDLNGILMTKITIRFLTKYKVNHIHDFTSTHYDLFKRNQMCEIFLIFYKLSFLNRLYFFSLILSRNTVTFSKTLSCDGVAIYFYLILEDTSNSRFFGCICMIRMCKLKFPAYKKITIY